MTNRPQRSTEFIAGMLIISLIAIVLGLIALGADLPFVGTGLLVVSLQSAIVLLLELARRAITSKP